MVAEAKQHAATEKIVRHFLLNEHNRPVHYGFSRSAAQPFIAVKHVAGLDDDATIQHDIWGVDKESTLDQVTTLLELYENVNNYQTPYGVLAGADPITYTWMPDEEQSRYVLDVRVSCFTTV